MGPDVAPPAGMNAHFVFDVEWWCSISFTGLVSSESVGIWYFLTCCRRGAEWWVLHRSSIGFSSPTFTITHTVSSIIHRSLSWEIYSECTNYAPLTPPKLLVLDSCSRV
jgi:hypothetical protein